MPLSTWCHFCAEDIGEEKQITIKIRFTNDIIYILNMDGSRSHQWKGQKNSKTYDKISDFEVLMVFTWAIGNAS